MRCAQYKRRTQSTDLGYNTNRRCTMTWYDYVLIDKHGNETSLGGVQLKVEWIGGTEVNPGVYLGTAPNPRGPGSVPVAVAVNAGTGYIRCSGVEITAAGAEGPAPNGVTYRWANGVTGSEIVSIEWDVNDAQGKPQLGPVGWSFSETVGGGGNGVIINSTWNNGPYPAP
jgi:hypothetical protein